MDADIVTNVVERLTEAIASAASGRSRPGF
jgi:hypothetical protein